MTSSELSANLNELRLRATRLARVAKRLQDDNDATTVVDGRRYVPATLPTHAFAGRCPRNADAAMRLDWVK